MISWKEVVSISQTILHGKGRDTSRPRQVVDIQYSITIMGGREISRALKKSCFFKIKTKNAYDL